MNIWIVTTGNSDVILQHDLNWGKFHEEVRDDLECWDFACATPRDKDNESVGFTVPARVLGQVYAKYPDYYGDDLSFPLLDTYREYFEKEEIKLKKIIVLLTDQAQIFHYQEQRIHEKSPYWQDTSSIEPLLKWYFQKHQAIFKCQPEFVTLAPETENKGIDHWDATLSLVTKVFDDLDLESNYTAYVSHQAGTPATSSAVQFVSLGKFKDVKFIVSNQYFDESYQQKSESDEIASSSYWRGMQIQKARQLIITGFPGAALKILEQIDGISQSAIAELNSMVDFFNLYNPLANSSQELTVPQATQRIIDALDLISFFFGQKNYLQGITLLAASQETFLKVAILSKVALIKDTVILNNSPKKVCELLEWVPSGLCLSSSIDSEHISFKQSVWQKLKFNNYKNNKIINKNSFLIGWLKNLDSNFPSWNLLDWYCDDNRIFDDDLRNQFMHNLRGVEDIDVAKYLLGYQQSISVNNVLDTYANYVKQPFINAIDYFNLFYKREKLNNKLQEIANSFK
ncbi:hypothetical protein [Nostoc sp. FACHB-110]|uniref:hypothetical protein n=1 Tax=Nostoc sp. FACHB-110 TaxID=2692834 RepID=UPI00168775E9|nr:hypothetical protein [Nostoc sp. FACHB-110]MBD2440580.1 hypothetical protein [Nostoc sp. FACHB-110]